MMPQKSLGWPESWWDETPAKGNLRVAAVAQVDTLAADFADWAESPVVAAVVDSAASFHPAALHIDNYLLGTLRGRYLAQIVAGCSLG